MALFQVSGSLATFFFSRYLLKYIESNLEWLFTGIGIAFTVMIFAMILFVKEGPYPHIDDGMKEPTLMENIKLYFRECYSLPFYYSIFAMIALSDASLITRGMFNVIYARDTLHIPVDDIGIMLGWSGLVGVILGYPVGIIVDKIGALKVYALGLLLVIGVNLWSFFFVDSAGTFYVSTILLGVVYCVQMTSSLPVLVVIYPRTIYGQFCSAAALFRAAFVAIIGLGGGLLFDWLQNYQYIFMWDFLFTLAAFFCWIKLYFDWRKLGGAETYIAPMRHIPCKQL